MGKIFYSIISVFGLLEKHHFADPPDLSLHFFSKTPKFFQIKIISDAA